MELREFIIEHLLKTQNERVIDIVFSRQKSVLGFGENTLTLRALSQKYDCSSTRIQDIARKQANRIKNATDNIIKEARKPAIIKEVKEQFLDRSVPSNEISINVLDLGTRAQNCLNNDNITTINQLLEISERDLLTIPNFGRRCIVEINSKLAPMGLKIGQHYKPD